MSAKKTPWISGDKKPVRVGVYERQDKTNAFWFWNGDYWVFGGTSSLGSAHRRGINSPHQSLPWRGLASDPSKKPKRK